VPDGNRIVCSSGARRILSVKNANGAGDEMPLLWPTPNERYPSDWSRDGKYLIYTEVDPKTQADVWYLPDPGKPGSQPVRFMGTGVIESQGHWSPDGHWLAYVYIEAFPTGGSRAQIADKAQEPRWSKTGNELFLLRPTADHADLLVAPVQTGPPISAHLAKSYETQGPPLINVVTNWQKLIPATSR
jgi:eukaryotic-like serine/threonine-protein kinase